MLLAGFAFIGFIFNIWLYIDDKKNRGSNLDKVPSANKEEGEGGLTDMMTSPEQTRKGPPGAEVDEFDMKTGQDDFVEGAVITEAGNGDEMLDLYKSDRAARDGLKRSMAKASMKM